MRSNRRHSVQAAGLALVLVLPAALCECPAAAAPHTEAAPATPADAEREVKQAHADRFALMVAGDTAALAAVLADDLVYVHSSGAAETKAEFLAAISSGRMRYRAITDRETAVRTYGDVALVGGLVDVQVTVGGQDAAPTLRYLAVYARQGGAWRLVAWQSTRVPPA
jgi:ketosteroid isomerase-like protein